MIVTVEVGSTGSSYVRAIDRKGTGLNLLGIPAGWIVVGLAAVLIVVTHRRHDVAMTALAITAGAIVGYVGVMALAQGVRLQFGFENGTTVGEDVLHQHSRPAWGLAVGLLAAAVLVTSGLRAEARHETAGAGQ